MASKTTEGGGWHSQEQALAVAREALDLMRSEIERLRDALTCQTARVDELLASNARLRQTIAQMDRRSAENHG